ncbi:TPA: hypothetical protein ACIU15_000033 [Yersinia enterocolitica]|uniref:hypothetical protein n=1 Tax=Yersinia TaxID=629 RepID=UPI0005E69A0F|nr:MULTISPECIES: hypothetical protein [Yersinia]EKN3828348.1 hypothetical protein [Yersinia enterocolitica]EKN4749200.1 hypothetical protein [Yersinia enterocolitica]EKN4807544.1 hypothetical protein [Yersinia enterocolitica]EKN4826772.1 hypothetical protein [Yersinia enterocolitica]EKN4877939.1 hypothetical protein [Yersinia enterocolitica]
MSEIKSNVDAELDELEALLQSRSLACSVINSGFRKQRLGPVVVLPDYSDSNDWNDALDKAILAIRDAGLPEAVMAKEAA